MGDFVIDENMRNVRRSDENMRNIQQLVFEVDFRSLQTPSPSRPNANRSSAGRHYHSRRQNRRNHHYNRRGSPYGRRGSSNGRRELLTSIKKKLKDMLRRFDLNSGLLTDMKEYCRDMKDILHRCDLNITSIKDLISQQTELMKLAIEHQARPAS